MLARRLGDDLYFFGKSPSSLDALVYGHLAPLLKAPLPNPTLQNHLKACVNLVSFVVRITQNYFAETALEYEKVLSDKQAEEAARAAAAAASSKCLVDNCLIISRDLLLDWPILCGGWLDPRPGEDFFVTPPPPAVSLDLDDLNDSALETLLFEAARRCWWISKSGH